jgi:hypothetical protein
MMAGANKASLYNSMSQLNSQTIGNIADKLVGQGGQAGIVGDAMNVAKSMGLEGADAISWVADKVGMGTDAVMGVLTGAANEVAGATWGLFGAGPQTLGGASAATAGGGTATAAGGATSGAAGFGATLAAASPLLAFGGIIALNELLGSSRDVDKNIKKIQTSSDPLATIAEMDSSDLDALFARDGSKIDVSYGVSSQQKRGSMYAMILNTLPEEQLSEIRQRDDLSTIANDLFQSALSGRGLHAKLGEVGNVNSGEALAKLFPTIDPAQFTQLQNLSNRVRSATAYNNDYAGDFNGMTRTPQYVPTEELNALKTALYSQMQTELASYQNQSTARSMLVA